MKKGSTKKRKLNSGTYDACELTPEVRELVGKLFLHGKEFDIDKSVLVDLLEVCDVSVSDRTIFRWKKKVKQNLPVISPSKASGKPRTLSKEQDLVTVGYILVQILEKQQITRGTILNFLRENWSITVDRSTISRWFNEWGVVWKAGQSRTTGYKVVITDATKEYDLFLRDKCHPLIRNKDLSKIASFDFTYTQMSRRKLSSFTFSGL
jgi:transposase